MAYDDVPRSLTLHVNSPARGPTHETGHYVSDFLLIGMDYITSGFLRHQKAIWKT